MKMRDNLFPVVVLAIGIAALVVRIRQLLGRP